MSLRRTVSNSLIFIATLGLFTLTAITLVYDLSFAMVTSRSMEPSIQAGDIVVTRQITKKEISDGDVLVLPLPQNRELKFMHRVIEVNDELGMTRIRTKGDANPRPDRWQIEIISPDVPKVISVIGSGFIFAGPIGREFIFTTLIGGSIVLLILGLTRLLARKQS